MFLILEAIENESRIFLSSYIYSTAKENQESRSWTPHSGREHHEQEENSGRV